MARWIMMGLRRALEASTYLFGGGRGGEEWKGKGERNKKTE